MEYKAAKNDRVLQERDDQSQNLANIRRQLAGAPVGLPERPKEHYYRVDFARGDGRPGHGLRRPSYERVQIERWLQEHDTSPLTNAKLANAEMLLPAHALRQLIEQWDEKMHEYALELHKQYSERLVAEKQTPPRAGGVAPVAAAVETPEEGHPGGDDGGRYYAPEAAPGGGQLHPRRRAGEASLGQGAHGGLSVDGPAPSERHTPCELWVTQSHMHVVRV